MEDLAYMVIDDSMIGTGHHKTWERWYDEAQADVHAKKMALVRRRVEQRTVKIRPYSERPELLSDTFKVGPHGRDIHGQIAGGAAFFDAMEEPTGTGIPVRKYLKAAKAMLKKKGSMKGGSWFDPSTWTLESVNPMNWTKKDWTDLAKGADAALFGVLAEPAALSAAVAALKAGTGLSLPPPIGQVSGEVLAMMLTGAVLAHEYVYPACEKGKKTGVAGCNEYRDDVKDVIHTAVDIAGKSGAHLDRVSEFLTEGIGSDVVIQPGDIMGLGSWRSAMTRTDGKNAPDFYWPAFSGREARGVMSSGAEYTGPVHMPPASVLPPTAPTTTTLSRVGMF